MNKKFLGIVIAVVVIIFAIIMIKKNNTVSTVISDNTENTTTQTTTDIKTETTTDPVAATATVKAFTLADVMTHNTEANCYAAINGKVYDLTAWINKHPGGDRNILRICGLDGSSAFNGQHGGESKPEKILEGFEVGILAQ